uniref:Uncharacterized protein n=1 Tax=viral metagenome TaxID=1070528 RepID=A0A6M3IYE5_9ZZZZ
MFKKKAQPFSNEAGELLAIQAFNLGREYERIQRQLELSKQNGQIIKGAVNYQLMEILAKKGVKYNEEGL